MAFVDNWAVGKEVCYWLSNDIVGVQSVTLCVCIWGGFSLQGRDGDVRVENLCYEGRVKGKRRVRERKGDLMR